MVKRTQIEKIPSTSSFQELNLKRLVVDTISNQKVIYQSSATDTVQERCYQGNR